MNGAVREMAMDELREAHAALYAGIPEFRCKPGCSECCGPIPQYTPWEWERLSVKKRAKEYCCPYRTDGPDYGCAIYGERFFLCRLMGSSEDLRCPYGCAPETPLTREESRELRRRFFELAEVIPKGD